MSRFFGSVALAVFLLVPSGCSDTQAEAEHEHHHHHSSSRSLEGVVKLVAKQHRWAVQAAARDDALHFQHELSHFQESVALLPELAAETDLRKADWDRVHAASKVLAVEGVRLGESKSPPSDAQRVAADDALRQLDEIVGKLSPRRKESKSESTKSGSVANQSGDQSPHSK